jgi:uncharacterized protein (TIGR02118 family)
VTNDDDATIVCVVYPRTKPGDHFDHIYYVNRHLALVRHLWSDTGLDEVTSARGVAAPDGGAAPIFAITLLRFASAVLCRDAMAGDAVSRLMADIPRFTNVTPTIQLSAPLV